jgi:hypothetical protein
VAAELAAGLKDIKYGSRNSYLLKDVKVWQQNWLFIEIV